MPQAAASSMNINEMKSFVQNDLKHMKTQSKVNFVKGKLITLPAFDLHHYHSANINMYSRSLHNLCPILSYFWVNQISSYILILYFRSIKFIRRMLSNLPLLENSRKKNLFQKTKNSIYLTSEISKIIVFPTGCCIAYWSKWENTETEGKDVGNTTTSGTYDYFCRKHKVYKKVWFNVEIFNNFIWLLCLLYSIIYFFCNIQGCI